MSLTMVYVIGNSEFSMPIRDDEIFSRLEEKYPREIEAVFGVKEPGPGVIGDGQGVVSRIELLAALQILIVLFKNDPDLKPVRYVFDFDIIPGVPVTGDDDVHAIKLPGKKGNYRLFGGFGRCMLREYKTVSGCLFPVYQEPLDMRHHTVIETESHGPINIRTTKSRSPIAGDLKRLHKFLQSHLGDEVKKILA
jgi:hypothetical protein